MLLEKRRIFLAIALTALAASGPVAKAPAQQQSAAPSSGPEGHRGTGHAENHDWYRELKQPGTGYSCCNGTTNGIEGDCRRTRAYLTEDGTWRALIDGKWVPVPPRVVLRQMAPDGNSHICASRTGVIYCFLAGSPKS